MLLRFVGPSREGGGVGGLIDGGVQRWRDGDRTAGERYEALPGA